MATYKNISESTVVLGNWHMAGPGKDIPDFPEGSVEANSVKDLLARGYLALIDAADAVEAKAEVVVEAVVAAVEDVVETVVEAVETVVEAVEDVVAPVVDTIEPVSETAAASAVDAKAPRKNAKK